LFFKRQVCYGPVEYCSAPSNRNASPIITLTKRDLVYHQHLMFLLCGPCAIFPPNIVKIGYVVLV